MRFQFSQPNAGRKRVPGVVERARQVVEANVCAILAPHFRALGYEPVIEDGEIVLQLIEDGGAKLHGESRDGVVQMSPHADLAMQMEAAEKLLNRTHGRPKQVTEVSGADGGPIKVESADITDPEVRKLAHEMLARRSRGN